MIEAELNDEKGIHCLILCIYFQSQIFLFLSSISSGFANWTEVTILHVSLTIRPAIIDLTAMTVINLTTYFKNCSVIFRFQSVDVITTEHFNILKGKKMENTYRKISHGYRNLKSKKPKFKKKIRINDFKRLSHTSPWLLKLKNERKNSRNIVIIQKFNE